MNPCGNRDNLALFDRWTRCHHIYHGAFWAYLFCVALVFILLWNCCKLFYESYIIVGVFFASCYLMLVFVQDNDVPYQNDPRLSFLKDWSMTIYLYFQKFSNQFKYVSDFYIRYLHLIVVNLTTSFVSLTSSSLSFKS